MFRRMSPCLVALWLVLAPTGATAVELPHTITVQGRMDTSGGAPADGTFAVTFRLFATDTGGLPLWTQGVASLVVGAGIFDAELGPLTPALLEGNPVLWLETQVGSTVLGRKPLYPVATALYAERAGESALAGDLACTKCVQSAEVDFIWAKGSSKGGGADSLGCTSCVNATHLADGAVANKHIQTGAVTDDKVGFNYAGSDEKGGKALNLECPGCVGSGDLAADLELDGSLKVEGSVLACTGGGAGCGVKIAGAGLYENAAGYLLVQVSDGLRVRSLDDGAYRPVSFGGGTSHGDLAVTGGTLSVTEGDLTVTGTTGGKVGVGTTNPQVRLHVSSGAAGPVYRFESAPGRYVYGGSDGAGAYIEQVGDTPSQRVLRIQNSDGAGTYTQLFLDGANQRITTGEGVKVGIGTNTPTVPLQVEGAVKVAGPVTARSFLDTSENFHVDGDGDKYYAVVFYDNGWAQGPANFEINRSSVHTDAQWWGAMNLSIDWHSSSWGHGAALLKFASHYSKQPFVASVQDYYYNPYLLVWLRGGTTYYYRSSNNRVQLVDILGTDNQECSFDPVAYAEYGTARDCTCKTEVDPSMSAADGVTTDELLLTSKSFLVGGDTDKFYAVSFVDGAWGAGPAEFEITRSSVHTDQNWWGAMNFHVWWHSSSWGHGAAYLDYRYHTSQQSFVAFMQDYYYNPYLVIWLRGGTTYYYRSFGNRVKLHQINGTDNEICSFDPVGYSVYSTAMSCTYRTEVDPSIVGGRTIGTNLRVTGTVTAPAYNTGDIFFHKDGKMVWRMFEDEAGLYVESALTGKVYGLVLKELP